MKLKLIFLFIFYSKYLNCFSIFIDTIPEKKQIKLDVVSVYYSLFDVREQIRIGIEYEHGFNKKWNMNYHLDFGVFDRYQYNKYFQFFPNNTNGYKEQTDVTTFGFHFLYGLKYKFKTSSKKLRPFVGLLSDFNFFNKKSVKYNTLDHSTEKSKYQQYRIGLGPEIGMSFKLYKRICIEMKTAMLLKLFSFKTKDDSPMIKPHKALWYDVYHSYWIIPRLNVCYEF